MTVAAAGLIGLAAMALVLVADVSVYIAAGFRASAAADAAALAAAPLTFQQFGSSATPLEAAREFAARNGSTLARCKCAEDSSWSPRTVEVVVRREVSLILFGSRTVSAIGRAEFVPTQLH